MTRIAISPRLAMRTLLNMPAPCRRSQDYSNRAGGPPEGESVACDWNAFALRPLNHDPALPIPNERPERTTHRAAARHLILSLSRAGLLRYCLLYTSDAADEEASVDLGGRR